MPSFPDVFNLVGLNGAGGFRFDSGGAGEFTGRAVGSAGDINGDGFDDLIVTAPGADPGGRAGAGMVYVVFGKAGGFSAALAPGALNGTNGFKILGAAAGDGAGASVDWAGDLNNDGFDDLIIGAPSADPGGRDSAGAAYVVFGKQGGFGATLDLASLDGTNGFRLEGQTAGDFLGQTVAGVGDFNGDQLDDLLIGATGRTTGGAHAGAAYLVRGMAGGWAASQSVGALNGVNGFRIDGGPNEVLGRSLGGAGDVNGDGFADLIVGAPDHSDPIALPAVFSASPGAAYVIYGRSAGLSPVIASSAIVGAQGLVLNGTVNNGVGDRAGVSVGWADDINGDGIDDLIVGADWFDPNGLSNAGAAFVVFGKAGGLTGPIALDQLNGTNGFRLNGSAAGDFAGGEVTAIGDLNADGYADLLIGAEAADPGGRATAGSAYVLFGKGTAFAPVIELSALAGAAGFRIDGVSAGDLLSSSAAAAGDLNGDGIDDLVLGAERAGGAFTGAAYVIFGQSASGATNGVDNLVGTAAPEGFRALGGADTLQGLGGDDLLDGGDGLDKAIYASTAANYEWYSLPDGAWRVRDWRAGSPEGTDKLNGIESLQFSDRTVKILGLTTAEKLTGAYEHILRKAATGAEASFLTNLIASVTGLQTSLFDAVSEIVAKADQTTAVAALSYQFFLGFTPSTPGFDFLVSPQGPNPNNINSAYYQSFNIENRYINFAVNLGKNGEGAASFLTEYGAKTLFQATKDAYMEIFGGTVVDSKIDTILNSSVGAMSRAEYFALYGGDGLTGIGTKAAMVGWLLTEAAKADVGMYAQSSNAFLIDMADGARTLVDLVGVYGQPGYIFNG